MIQTNLKMSPSFGKRMLGNGVSGPYKEPSAVKPETIEVPKDRFEKLEKRVDAHEYAINEILRVLSNPHTSN